MHKVLQCFLILASIFSAATVQAHGGVSLFADDVCIISIDFLDAHFTVFQPNESGTTEFCEEVPEVAESVFVIDYLHDFLKEMPVDFRIIKDVNNLGFYASWDDIEQMQDIDVATVFYKKPEIEREGIYTVNYQFEEPGIYIGIVTAKDPEKNKIYRAVFPFEVGGKNWGLLPLFIFLIIAAQVAYWYFNKRTKSE